MKKRLVLKRSIRNRIMNLCTFLKIGFNIFLIVSIITSIALAIFTFISISLLIFDAFKFDSKWALEMITVVGMVLLVIIFSIIAIFLGVDK